MGAYFTAYVAYTKVYPVYIKARKLLLGSSTRLTEKVRLQNREIHVLITHHRNLSSSFHLTTFTTKNTIARGLRAAVVIKDFIIKALEAYRVVKLNHVSNTDPPWRCIVFLRLMLLVVEILLIILRSMGTGHSVECSASAKCIIKCMGRRVLGYSRLFTVSFFLSLACLVTFHQQIQLKY